MIEPVGANVAGVVAVVLVVVDVVANAQLVGAGDQVDGWDTGAIHHLNLGLIVVVSAVCLQQGSALLDGNLMFRSVNYIM